MTDIFYIKLFTGLLSIGIYIGQYTMIILCFKAYLEILKSMYQYQKKKVIGV